MKVAIIFADGMKQINFTPENEDEKQALKLITPQDDIELAVTSSSFGPDGIRPYGIKVEMSRGGCLRAYGDEQSIMLVLKPKKKDQ